MCEAHKNKLNFLFDYSDKMATTSNDDNVVPSTISCADSARTLVCDANKNTSVNALRALTASTERRVSKRDGDMALNYTILSILAKIDEAKDEDKRLHHVSLRNLIKREKLQDDENFKKYLEEFEHLHYELDSRGSKMWRNEIGYHRTTKDENGMQLPAYVYTDGGACWYVNGQPHRTDKDAEGMQLPARCVNGGKEWYINGASIRHGLDRYGNSLPTGVTSDGIQIWHGLGNRTSRAELGKNPNDNFNMALPAIIRPSGKKEWWNNGTKVSQDDLTKSLGGSISNTVIKTDVRALDELLIRCQQDISNKMNLADNYVLMGLLIRAAEESSEEEKSAAHLKLRKHFVKHNVANVEKYMAECECYHYEIHSDGSKRWYNKKHELSRTTKDVNGQTLPAIVYDNGDQIWYLDGKRHRTDLDSNGRVLPAFVGSDGKKVWHINGEFLRDDRDEFGHRLPTIIEADGGMVWTNAYGSSCREELGRNPADVENFGKALPAIIKNGGAVAWADANRYYSQDRMTQKITGIKAPMLEKLDCSKIQKISIKTKNGDTFELTDLAFVQVLR